MSNIYTKKEIIEAFNENREPRISGTGKMQRYLATKKKKMSISGIQKRLKKHGIEKIDGWFRLTAKELDQIFQPKKH